MKLVRTLLAVWLTLAVPAAGVAAVSTPADCVDHGKTAQPHQSHGGHDVHAAGPGPSGPDCNCPCDTLHCGTALSVLADAPVAVHEAPRGRLFGAEPPDGIAAAHASPPFRPPASP